MKKGEIKMKNQLAFRDHTNGSVVMKMLLEEGYVVMLSYEEELLILNYEWSENNANRNDMVFMRRDEYEEELDKQYENILHDLRVGIRNGYFKDLSEI